jgi:hypothetical protein
MFFADPVAGSANLCRALRPGGRLAFVCWQSRFTSEWMTVPGAVFRSFVGAPDLGLPEGPGPFALAHPERVVEILTAAGFETIGIKPVHEPLLLGHDAFLNPPSSHPARRGPCDRWAFNVREPLIGEASVHASCRRAPPIAGLRTACEWAGVPGGPPWR